MATKRAIERTDILAPKTYSAERKALREKVIAVKRNRRMEVGPFATFYFENYETMWHQVHEMLHIEKGDDAQIEDELRAYNPLIPQGREWVATVMLEIEDPVRRATTLQRLGGIENRMFLTVAGETIRGVPESEVERTKADGKTSSVHFVRFPLSEGQVAAARRAGAQIIVGFDHPDYAHMAMMPDAVRLSLVEDLD